MMRTRQRFVGWQPYILGTLAVGMPAAALYVLTGAWPDTPDGLFHLHRVRALAEALRMGVLYPRLFPDFAFGYGYPVLNYYAPAFYYPSALLHLAGLDLIVAVRVVLAVSYALSGLALYIFVRCWVSPLPAALGATLYLVYPYRFYDLFVRGALPEFVAFLWLPLIAVTTARWLEAINQPSALKTGMFAALSWAGLILTHNLTALMAGVAALFVAGLLGLSSLVRWARGGPRSDLKHGLRRGVIALILPPALGGAFSAPYMLPALLETDWVGIGTTAQGRGYALHFAALRDLLDRSWVYRYPDVAQPTVPAPGYVVAILILAAVVLLLPQARGKRVILGCCAGLAAFVLWLSTASSAFLWDGLAQVLGKLQFPWRWQTIAALALACALGIILDIGGRWLVFLRSHKPGFSQKPGLYIGLILGIYLVFQSYAGLDPLPASYSASNLTTGQMWAFDAEHGQVGASWTGEFLPLTVQEQRWALGQPREDAQDGATAARPVVHVTRRSYDRFILAVETTAPLTVRLHQFYLPAWQATLNRARVPAYPTGELGLVSADLPAGVSQVAFRFGPTPARIAGELVALLTATLWALAVWRSPSSPKWLRKVAVVLVALVVVLGLNSLGIAQRSWTPKSVQWALGDVALLVGYDAVPVRSRDALDVTLYWFGLRDVGTNYKTFVHLLTPDGQVIAQHDGDPGGGFTPTTRWRTGELVLDTHRLSLPVNPASGSYRLKAGMYQLEPFRNLSVDPPSRDGRADLGEVVIQ